MTNSNKYVYTNYKKKKTGKHAVSIIGWDDKLEAWLCKNSWGDKKGPNKDGTFWISYTNHTNSLNLKIVNVEIEVVQLPEEKTSTNNDSEEDYNDEL